ncbi:MAG: hypothetical protein VB934_16995, partial [Polyangiaceae bacterium]
MAVSNGIVDKSGSWFSYGEERIGQGREKVRHNLESNSELLNEIENKVRAAYGMGMLAGTTPPETAETKASNDNTNDAKAKAKEKANAPATISRRAKAG